MMRPPPPRPTRQAAWVHNVHGFRDMSRSLRHRRLAIALLALAIVLPSAAGLLAKAPPDRCPLQDDDCCLMVRLACCDEAPAPAQATVPGGQQTLRAPGPTDSATPPAIAGAVPFAVLVVQPAVSPPPLRLLDLPVFLHVLLI